MISNDTRKAMTQQCSKFVAYIENLLSTNGLLTTSLNMIVFKPRQLVPSKDVTSGKVNFRLDSRKKS